jgi:N6-adenosine-specific RNA methylase IME4
MSGAPPRINDLLGAVSSGLRFSTIYADPPWRYENQAARGAAGKHYDTMTVDDICSLPVRQLAADDASLFLWVTNAFLFDAYRIFDAWGFEFRDTFVWCKRQMGTGNYWRNSHEMLLTAARGIAAGRFAADVPSYILCARGAHSAKPEQVRHFIERSSPGPYLEMFGRLHSPGWTVWGNQVRDDLFSAA